ncbi:MAG: hypothetical protein CVV42_12380 [Candidatus Riflebacteria bacterium HGW-Riflebacteria-2]|nr:MAG: hypothetical protein CVV42_12380 [Candidatus Riflebacteria bacterium HGW-Riflebacteria-2]
MINLNLNRSGKIKTRIFALILLMLSCSMLISAYRSLGREFSGVVVKRTTSPGITSTQYYLHIRPAGENLSRNEVIAALTETESDRPSHRYGVSAIVYEQAQLFEQVSKSSFSFFIAVGGENYLDLGLLWLLMGLAGIIISIVMHFQTINRRREPKYQSEDIDIPGLE